MSALKLNKEGDTETIFPGIPFNRVVSGLTGYANGKNIGMMFLANGQFIEYNYDTGDFVGTSEKVNGSSKFEGWPFGDNVVGASVMVPGSSNQAYFFVGSQYCIWNVKNWKKKSDALDVANDFGGISRIVAALTTENDNLMLIYNNGQSYKVWNPDKKTSVAEGSTNDLFPQAGGVVGSFVRPRGNRPSLYIFNSNYCYEYKPGTLKP